MAVLADTIFRFHISRLNAKRRQPISAKTARFFQISRLKAKREKIRTAKTHISRLKAKQDILRLCGPEFLAISAKSAKNFGRFRFKRQVYDDCKDALQFDKASF